MAGLYGQGDYWSPSVTSQVDNLQDDTRKIYTSQKILGKLFRIVSERNAIIRQK